MPERRNFGEKQETIESSIEAGLEYLSRQRKEGVYAETFGFRHGDSTAWSTCYVGRLLYEIDPKMAKESVASVLDRQNGDEGWGYNESVTSDADSTANAILFLQKCGVSDEILNKGKELILQHQHSNGGISTYTLDNLKKMGYERGGGWSAPHSCVTALAARVLEGGDQERAQKFLLAQKKADGSYPAYWWASDLYSTFETMLSLSGNAEMVSYFKSAKARSSFELALKIQALILSKEKPDSEIGDLLKMQQSDGSWPSSEILKIPRPHVKPGEEVQDMEVVKDGNRFFSTANSLVALDLAKRRS